LRPVTDQVSEKLHDQEIAMNKNAIRHGFILLGLALAFGLAIPSMEVPRLGLSAHTIGVLSGVLLLAVGSIWQLFALSSRQLSILYWSWLYSSYVNWLAVLVGAIFGSGGMTPVASGDYQGSAFIEGTVTVLLITVVVSSFLAVGLSIWGLRGDNQSDV
jgi:hydroxylaminobenzene mutase